METKFCKLCNKDKTLANFYYINSTNKYHTYCKICHKVKSKLNKELKAKKDFTTKELEESKELQTILFEKEHYHTTTIEYYMTSNTGTV